MDTVELIPFQRDNLAMGNANFWGVLLFIFSVTYHSSAIAQGNENASLNGNGNGYASGNGKGSASGNANGNYTNRGENDRVLKMARKFGNHSRNKIVVCYLDQDGNIVGNHHRNHADHKNINCYLDGNQMFATVGNGDDAKNKRLNCYVDGDGNIVSGKDGNKDGKQGASCRLDQAETDYSDVALKERNRGNIGDGGNVVFPLKPFIRESCFPRTNCDGTPPKTEDPSVPIGNS